MLDGGLRIVGPQFGSSREFTGAARFRVVQHHVAQIGQFEVAAIDDLDSEQFVPAGQCPQGALPVERAEEIAHHDRQTAAALGTSQRLDEPLEITAGPVGCVRGCRDGTQQRLGVQPPTTRGDAGRLVAGGDHRADPIPAAGGQMRERGHRCDRQVALLTHAGTEVQAGREVDREPRLEFPVGDGLPHVRVRRARGDRPVHLPHVVTRLVLAGVPRLGTGARDQTEMVAVQDAVETAPHGELEGAERGGERGIAQFTGPEPRWRPVVRTCAHRAPAPPCGSGAPMGAC